MVLNNLIDVDLGLKYILFIKSNYEGVNIGVWFVKMLKMFCMLI